MAALVINPNSNTSILGTPQYTGVFNASNYSQAYSDPAQVPVIGPELKTSHMGGKRRENKQKKNKKGNSKKAKMCYGGKTWSSKYKKSINCSRPKGFSQKQYCKYGRKTAKKM
jgi:hypothetical protein